MLGSCLSCIDARRTSAHRVRTRCFARHVDVLAAACITGPSAFLNRADECCGDDDHAEVRGRAARRARRGRCARCGIRGFAGRGRHAAAAAEVRAGRQRLPARGLAGELRRDRRRRLVRVRADRPRPRRRRWRSSCTATTSSPATRRCTSSSGTRCAKGNVVIYPRWQTGVADPVPRPVRHRAVHDVGGERHPRRARVPARGRSRVQPRARRTSYFGFSFGGIITANLANRYRRCGLPKPRAIFLDDPHDGGLNGVGEPALDDSLAGIPSTREARSATRAPRASSPEPSKADGSCNAVFPKLRAHPGAEQGPRADPRRRARHAGAVAAARRLRRAAGAADAYDWNFCWKVWDALRSCAYCGHVAAATRSATRRKHRSNGRWSDGVPITPLKIQDGGADPALSRLLPRQAPSASKPALQGTIRARGGTVRVPGRAVRGGRCDQENRCRAEPAGGVRCRAGCRCRRRAVARSGSAAADAR